jgi:hypothetical protein
VVASRAKATTATADVAPGAPPTLTLDQSPLPLPPWAVVPRTPAANLTWRKRVWGLAADDHNVQARLLELCRQDLVFFVNAFVWTFNARRGLALPMATWPDQDRALLTIRDAIEVQEDLLIEKSRDQGASWDVLVTFLWFWLFQPASMLAAVSNKEENVDKRGDPDSLFWKFRYALYRLPSWMKPSTVDSLLHLENRSNGSVLSGMAATGSVRGGRRLAVMMDEHAHIEAAQALETATADVTDCRLRVSTPCGMNTFGRLRHSGNCRVLTLHWSKRPSKSRGLYASEGGKVKLLDGYRGPVETRVKDPITNTAERRTFAYPDAYPFVLDGKMRSPWYDGECVRRGSDMEIAQELDIEYYRSGHAWFDGAVVQRLKATTVRAPDVVGDLLFHVVPGDPSIGDSDRIVVDSFQPSPTGMLRWWGTLDVDGRPHQRTNYAVGSDISEGTGASNSVSSVYDCTNGRKVGELVTCNQSPEAFARTTVALCEWLGGECQPYLTWEQNGPGLIFGREVVKLGYSNIYLVRKEAEVDPRARGSSRTPGWVSSKPNKYLLLGDYRRDLAAGVFINPSGPAVEELLQYVVDDDGYPIHEKLTEDTAGARLAHGDRVIADALANLGRKELPSVVLDTMPIPAGSIAGRRMASQRKPEED